MTKTKEDQIGTFDCTGNVTVMRQALEACHRGSGTIDVIGVAPRRRSRLARSSLLPDGSGKARRSAARAAARCAEDRRLVHAGKIQIDPMITRDAYIRHQQGIRSDEVRAVDQRRCDVLTRSALRSCPAGPKKACITCQKNSSGHGSTICQRSAPFLIFFISLVRPPLRLIHAFTDGG
jgi:hypothetical protein